MEYVEANGLRFAYLSEGTGPLVLLLHGFPDTAHSWDALRPRLAAQGFRAVSPFLRGYRPTGLPDRDADAVTLARDVLALIPALGAERAILIGHDWGALSAYGATALEPARIAKLFVLAIPHPVVLKPDPRRLWRLRHFVAYKLPGASSRFAARDFSALDEIVRRWSPTWDRPASELDAVRACFADRASLDAAMGYYRALPFAAPKFMHRRIGVPTVGFVGSDDPMVDRADFENAARMFTGPYDVEVLPGGHFLHREYPDAFAERLLPHLTART
jgi:pimeloyl-ACP methyl ester carboxylesterase